MIDRERMTITDLCDPGRETVHHVRRFLADVTSARQRIVLAELERSGDSLWLQVLEGEDRLWLQFAEADESPYHDTLVKGALARHENPQDVIFLGGGDYLAWERVRSCRTARSAKIIDWDKKVGELVLEHFPWVRELGAHLDPRLDWESEVDITEYLPNTKDRAHVVVGDLGDTAAMMTLIPDFVRHIARILHPGGVFVTQAGPFSVYPPACQILAHSIAAIRDVFLPEGTVELSWCSIESFASPWAFITAWKGRKMRSAPPNWGDLERRFDLEQWKRHRSTYEPETHVAAFTIPAHMRRAIGY